MTDSVEFHLSPVLLSKKKKKQLRGIATLLCSGKQLTAESPPLYDLRKTRGRPPYLPVTRPDIDSPKSHSLSHK